MRLAGLYINGFGLFRDLRIERLSPGVTVFLGENESGKSTMLGFVRAILFGFPDGRRSENPYPPLSGGNHGGSIELVDDQKQIYVVERSPGPHGGRVEVIKPDQTRENSKFLTHILGIGNRTLFNNIYAFSLSELQNFETLNTESVRETLYSAGAGVDPNRLSDLKTIIEKKEKDLFKPGGSKPEINRILSRLLTVIKERKTLQGSIEEYDLMKSEVTRLEKEIVDFEQKKLDRLKGIREKEYWISIFPEWINLTVSREKLSKMESIVSFPSQGVSRLEGLNSRLMDLKAGLVKAEQEYARQKNELPLSKTDPRILDFSESIRTLQKGQVHFDSVLRDIISLKQELASGETRLKEGMTRLGSSWNEDMILTYDLSIAVREEVRRYHETLDQAMREVQRKEDYYEGLAAKKREQEAMLNNIKEPAVKDFEQLNRVRRSLRELKSLNTDSRFTVEELRHLEERLKDSGDEKIAIDEDIQQSTSLPPLWLIFGIILLGVASLSWLSFYSQWIRGLSVLGASLIIGIAIWFVRIVLGKSEQNRIRHLERRKELICSKTADINEHMVRIRSDRDLLVEKVKSTESGLSITDTLSIDSLERMEHENQEHIVSLEQWEKSKDDLKQCERNFNDAAAELKDIKAKESNIKLEWNEWLKNQKLDTVLSPEGVLETLTLIQSCRDQIKNLKSLESRLEIREKTREEYLTLANEVLGSFEGIPENSSDIQVAVNDLIRDYEGFEQEEQKREILEREMAANHEMIEQQQIQIRDIKNEMAVLMSQGGADNEEQFRERSHIYEMRTELEREADGLEAGIRKLAMGLGDLSDVLGILPDIHFDELKDEKLRLDMELKGIEVTLDNSKKEQARLEERIRHLVNDEQISILRAEEESLKESLSLLADEWLINKLAQVLVKNARSRYEEERQPGVIAESGRFFKEMTLDKYPVVASPIGENRIEVVGGDNKRKEIAHLSRGTAEQLYLSLRFGFIKEFSKRSTQLPVIMDEILVNFDRKRAQATVKGIMELSREHQVLYFTCHPETVELFQEADHDVSVMEISGGKVNVRGQA